MKKWISPIFFAVLLILVQGCTQKRAIQDPISHDQAILIARQAAVEKGYAMKNFDQLPSKSDLSQDGKDWMFVFVCKNPAPIDCGFSVSVRRKGGAIEVHPLP